MRNIYNRIFGEEFMNSPVQGTKEEAKFMEQKINEFRKKQEIYTNMNRMLRKIKYIKINKKHK